MAKKKIEYAKEETPEERDRDMKIRDDLRRLNVPELLFSEYTSIYKQLMKRKGMTAVKANALATCELISLNNARLQIILEDWTGHRFPG